MRVGSEDEDSDDTEEDEEEGTSDGTEEEGPGWFKAGSGVEAEFDGGRVNGSSREIRASSEAERSSSAIGAGEGSGSGTAEDDPGVDSRARAPEVTVEEGLANIVAGAVCSALIAFGLKGYNPVISKLLTLYLRLPKTFSTAG